MSSRPGSRMAFVPSRLVPPPQSADVHMRSAVSDDETDTKSPAVPSGQGPSDRRRSFVPSKLTKPSVVVTYSPPSSQDPESSKAPAVTSKPGAVGFDTFSSGPSRNEGTDAVRPVSETPYPVQPTEFDRLTDPDFRSLQSLDAVLISSNFLRHHIKDLVWIKARLVEYESHIVRCRNLTMKNLNSIERALYAENRLTKLEHHLQSRDDSE